MTVSLATRSSFAIVAGLGDLDGILEHVAGAVREPEFEAALEQQRSEDRDEHRRNGGDGGKQRDEPDVQPPAAEPALLRPSHRDLARIKRHQRDRWEQDGDQQQRDQRRRQQTSRLRAAAQHPNAERRSCPTRKRGDEPAKAVVKTPARPLPLEPALLL